MTETEKYIIENYCGDLTYYESGTDIFSALSDSFQSTFSPAFGSLCIIVCLIAALAAVKALSDSFLTDGAPFELCMTLICSGVIYGSVRVAYDAAAACLNGMDILMDSMIAVMCVMYGLSGSVVGGSAAVTVLMAVMQAVRLVCTKLLLPHILFCLGASVLSGLGFNAGADKVVITVKRAVVFICGAAGAVVCFALAYQTVIVKTADGAALRALKLGASYVFGTDIDEMAVDTARENIETNGIASSDFEVLAGNIIDDPETQEKAGFEAYDICVANILADIIIPLQAMVFQHVKPGGLLIFSGIIDLKEQAVREAIEANPHLQILETDHQGEWVSFTVRRSA